LADGVNTAIKEVKSSDTQPMVHGARPEPELPQLRSRDHPVLPLGKRRNRLLQPMRLSFTLYFNVNLRRVGHAA
jgi:hypothetical protein